MVDESVEELSFYVPRGAGSGGREVFEATPHTAGPWSSSAQHGGPPSALLVRALERLPEAADRVVGRVTVDILGPVPMGTVATSAVVRRPGRTVCLVEAELVDVAADRPVARASAWLFPRAEGRPEAGGPPVEHGPEDGLALDRPAGWLGGYLDAIEWRWIAGTLERPGPGVVWMRAPRLVAGEEISPVQRLLACVDSASGASSCLDVRDWTFMNTELTVHVLRPPVGEWVCLDAVTTLAGTAVGVCTSTVSDTAGQVARSSQALLVVPRR